MTSCRYEELLQSWDGEMIASSHDPDTGAVMFICVHSTVIGPACGGIRMKAYDATLDALRDGMRLSSAMTLKMAICEAPFGGGKSVIDVDPGLPPEQRLRVLRRYAALLGSLRGTYYGGPDMNTGPDDMDVIHEKSPYVFNRTRQRGGAGSTSDTTALGVFHGIAAAVACRFGDSDLAGRTVLVQGVGGVGRALVEMLVHAGARVVVTDVATQRVAELVERLNVAAVPVRDALSTACDVFAPCAVGGVLDASSIAMLRCSVVAGAANNQLATPGDDERLRQRDILYAPDFVINAGGVLHSVGHELWHWTDDQVAKAAEGLSRILHQVFAAADAAGIGTQAAAEHLAHTKLAAATATGSRVHTTEQPLASGASTAVSPTV